MLSYADPQGEEMQALANLVTTNETYMFREYDQLQAFANHCLPEVLSAKQARGERTLRIWSAGCSSGEEPYTLAMILQEVFPQAQSWDCEIIATDIDENMLRKVAAARYGSRSVNEVPDEYREKYLIEDGDEYIVRRQNRLPGPARSSEPARPDGDAGHAGLRFCLLPQRSDLLRRSFAKGGCRSLLQCPESGRLRLSGAFRIGGTRDDGLQAEAV